jgi:putative ATPase
VLGARSLLWALDPLAATPEGQVLVAVESDADRQRLEAQLQLLDSLRRPSILLCQPEQPALLAAALEGPVEWVAGRQPFRGLAPAAIEAWITCLDARLAGQGHWRLLFSVPQLGPAGGLLALGQLRDGALAALLQELANLEQQALALEFAPAIHCQSCLEARHWRLDRERWQEALTMEITPTRIERWLAEGSSWRRQLESVANRRLSQGELQQLQRGFEANLAQSLPQQLEHLLVTSRRGPQAPSMGAAKQTQQEG